MKVARSTGNGQFLFPDGVTSQTECPIDLLRAIAHANKILDWYENLMTEEVPPEWMWPFDEELTEWFDEVRAARENPNSVDTREVVPMMENELASRR